MFETDYLRLYLRDMYSANMSLTKSGQSAVLFSLSEPLLAKISYGFG